MEPAVLQDDLGCPHDGLAPITTPLALVLRSLREFEHAPHLPACCREGVELRARRLKAVQRRRDILSEFQSRARPADTARAQCKKLTIRATSRTKSFAPAGYR